MNERSKRLEQSMFRSINTVVEPLVRRGIGSPSCAPASLVVLETVGFKSGQQRSTPLWSLRLGRYRLISTARGDRSFWVKNLQKRSQTRFIVGGKAQAAEAIVIGPQFDNLDEWELNSWLARLTSVLSRQVQQGWAFAILVPSEV
ncbi:nitroreductase/quinone reductase family protein [Halioglobus maricola]|nr:nitroreductase/quinone reductase family protein [Halioglobus maricola]